MNIIEINYFLMVSSEKKTFLRLTNTSIEYLGITGHLYDIEKDAFSNWTTLKTLDLSVASTLSFCNLFVNLEHLYLTDSNSPSICKAVKAPNLRVLKLKNNNLKNVYFDMWTTPKLEVLDLSHNRLKIVHGFSEPQKWPNLKYLDLSYQSSPLMLTQSITKRIIVREIPRNLVFVDISHTQLLLSEYDSIHLTENNSLQFVHLSHISLEFLRKPIQCSNGVQ